MLRKMALCVLALTACAPDGEAAECEVDTYIQRVQATVQLEGSPQKLQADAQARASAVDGELLVYVWEEDSIHACGDGLISSVTPGNELVRGARFATTERFELDVPITDYLSYPTERTLFVVLDDDGNGCDSGDATGFARLGTGAGPKPLAIVLRERDGCPVRR